MFHPHGRAGQLRTTALALSALALLLAPAGCRSPAEYRQEADAVAEDIVADKQQAGLGRTEPIEIEPPADTLRRRLMLDQDLPHRASASRSARDVDPIEQWPDPEYLDEDDEAEPVEPVPDPLVLTLREALRVAAGNSRDFQSQKEQVYRAALALDLERHAFRGTFSALMEGMVETDQGEDPSRTGAEGSVGLSFVQRLKTGATLTGRIAFDMAKLLSLDRSSSNGLFADASIEVPLLRGAGRFIVTEPLTQAERSALYAVWDFERFKREFAVRLASDYLGVLRQWDQVDNARENYRGLVMAGRRARRLADFGRLPELQVDQAMQDELRARVRWISAREDFERQLDSFKVLLGLPTDARVELDREELGRLAAEVEARLEPAREAAQAAGASDATPATPDPEAPIELVEPDPDAGGPYELDRERAVDLALEHRLDLWVAEGRVLDSQRRVAVAANGFLPELTLLGTGSAGGRRTLSSAGADDAALHFNDGSYRALLELDLPLDRTAERNVYRNALIDFERAVRDFQSLEDEVKLDARNNLRSLLESREGVHIQAQAAALAERRVASTEMLLEEGRAEIRDVLEAQEALVSSRNALTAAMIGYRLAELELQRDLGLLQVSVDGLWREFDPEQAEGDAEQLDIDVE